MNRPDNLQEYEELDLKLGIKSSLPRVKSTIALAILLWESANRPSKLVYAKQDGTGIVISDALKQLLIDYVSDICNAEHIDDEMVISTINENQLFKSQMEALIVAFELVWKLAKVSFVDTSKAASAERTGGSRYPKKLLYTINADIIHCLIESRKNSYVRVLMAWVGFNVEYDAKDENQMFQMLAALSESAIFKLTDGDKDVTFNQNSLYQKLLETHEPVDINGDKEAKGSLRILKSLLSDGLNPVLNYSGGFVSGAIQNEEELRSYQERVDTFLRLSATKVIGLEEKTPEEDEEAVSSISPYTGYKSGFERNRILFGAPGTGKSFTLNKQAKELIGADNEHDYERVTFHPDYSYANFVGTYKPIPCKDSDGKDAITYSYVPGPFMRVYVKALKNSREEDIRPFLLIVEEINRANVAAVFGDIFQLLDRGDDGVSEYPIQASEDIKKYLSDELGGQPEDYEKIRIPDNLFIWATMNSADQGVFPMDTAFKRRWDFTYLGIDESDKDIRGKYVYLADDRSQKVEWNKLRKAINNFLAREKINEDKQLGPYFISSGIVVPEAGDEIDRERFIRTFKNKVIMYLFEDAAKQKRSKLFEGCFNNASRYSEICREFEEKGIGIFQSEIQIETDPEEPPTQTEEAE